MIHKKMICFMFLFYLFPVAGCMKLIEPKKTSLVQLQLSFSERKSKYEKDAEEVRNQLIKRSGYRVLGNSPRAVSFLYSVYKAQNLKSFTDALMKESFFIELYGKEYIEDCSVFGIITMANAPFADKKSFIKKLLDKDYDCAPEKKIKHEFNPTVKDKEFAFFTKYKEFETSIIQEIYCTRYIEYGLDMPQEVKNYIEILLFWLKFDDHESLL